MADRSPHRRLGRGAARASDANDLSEADLKYLLEPHVAYFVDLQRRGKIPNPPQTEPSVIDLRVVPAAPGVDAVEIDVTLLAGERNRRVEARLGDTDAPPAGVDDREPRDGPSTKVPAIVALSVGGAGIGVGVVTGVLALGEDGALSDACPTESTCPPSEQDRIDRAGMFATVSTIGFVVGVVGVAAGVVLLVVGGDDAPPAGVSADARGLTLRF